MPKETRIPSYDEEPAKAEAPAAEKPAKKATDTGRHVVMHGAVSNWVRGCRVTKDDLYHKDHPTRDYEWERLLRLGAIKPESDPEAAAVPEAEPLPNPPPILIAAPDNLQVPFRRRN